MICSSSSRPRLRRPKRAWREVGSLGKKWQRERGRRGFAGDVDCGRSDVQEAPTSASIFKCAMAKESA
eukprot:5712398-Lingulodinium_polyedra.AAC.1